MMMQTDRANQGIDLAAALEVLANLAEAGCAVWVAGGWGVDALVGRQTRLHRDLDLAVDARTETVALRVLERRGYRVETDWRPARMELIAEGHGWVDVHPVVSTQPGTATKPTSAALRFACTSDRAAKPNKKCPAPGGPDTGHSTGLIGTRCIR